MCIVCNDCKVKEECDCWKNIQRIQSLAFEVLPDDICEGIDNILEMFNYCEYKE